MEVFVVGVGRFVETGEVEEDGYLFCFISPPRPESLEKVIHAERPATSLLGCETWLMDLDNRAGGTRSHYMVHARQSRDLVQ